MENFLLKYRKSFLILFQNLFFIFIGLIILNNFSILIIDKFINIAWLISLSIIALFVWFFFFIQKNELYYRKKTKIFFKYGLLFGLCLVTLSSLNFEFINNITFFNNIIFFLNKQAVILTVLSINLGFFTFYFNKEKIGQIIEKQQEKEDTEEQERMASLSKNFPKISTLPLLKNLLSWINKEGFGYVTLLIFSLTLFCIIYLINISYTKFIDIDETRLFYDATLILNGFKPFTDFVARAPFVIYFLSTFIYFFGQKLLPLYILSVILVLSILLLSYFLIKRLYNKKIGIISVIVFGSAPIILNLLYVKTQTFSVFLMLLSALLFDNYLLKNKRLYFFISLLLFLFSLFTRISCIVYLLIHISLFIKRKEFNIRQIIKTFSLYCLVFIIFILINSFFFQGEKSNAIGLSSSSNLTFDLKEADIARLRLIPVYLSSSFVLFIILSTLSLLFSVPFISNKKNRTVYVLPIFAILIYISLYTYNILRQHGFWPQYLMEFSFFYIILVSIFLYKMFILFEQKYFKYSLFIILILFLIISHIHSYTYLKNDAGWIDKDVASEVSVYINQKTDPADYIFGGVPIYSFLSNRRNILNLSHSYYNENSVLTVTDFIKYNPPKFIISDIYLRKYYITNDNFKQVLDDKYELLKIFAIGPNKSISDVEVYGLKTNPLSF